LSPHPRHISRLECEAPEAPETGLTIGPRTVSDVTSVLRYATEHSLVVQVWGGGTHSGYGNPPVPDLVMSMHQIDSVERWEPDDLTVVVGAGARVETVEAMLAERNQSLVMPEVPGAATIGGVIAAGASSLRRGRLYGTRERVLEVTMVTGDGRTVRSGGRVVKNVTGYDLHRLAVGAFGSLGVIVSVCLKLWPTPSGAATVEVDDLDVAARIARPLAVLETNGGIRVYLQGTEAEVESQADRLDGHVISGLDWPEDPDGPWRWSLRVPPAGTTEAIQRLPVDWRYVAVHGVGEVRCASTDPVGAGSMREWAESIGGHLVMTRGDGSVVDPWGTPPPGLDLQRRLIAEFDPARVINPGRLPGGL
jgi:glycolate oxidase FAD binding subunit